MAQSHPTRSNKRSRNCRRRERSYSPSRSEGKKELGYVIKIESDHGVVCSDNGDDILFDPRKDSFKSLKLGDRVAWKRGSWHRVFNSRVFVIEPTKLLSITDDTGKPFDISSARFYCAEDEYTRLARDIIFYTSDNKFLVKEWGSPGHRAKASHGNGFGTFIYRPPKNIPATENDIKFAKTMWEVETKGWLLTFTVNGLGYKNNLLAKMFGKEHHKEILHSALTSEASCYVMPSKLQSNNSSLSAPMTVLVNFLQHDEIDLKEFPGFAWQSLEQAIDPSCNVHAGVVATFCHENGMASDELLRKHGWEPQDLLVKVQLPQHVNTLEKLGVDPSIICTHMKKLILQAENLPKPLPRRTCNPPCAVEK